MAKAFTGCLLALTVLSGCHVYQPLIRHEFKPEDVQNYKVQRCTGNAPDTTALKRACLVREEMEIARSDHQYLNSITTNVLIPTAAFAAYRAARNEHPTSTGAIAAGGLAAYVTVGKLAPDGRIEAYTRGSKSLTCAISVYSAGAASIPVPIVERAAYDIALQTSRSLIDDKRKALPDKSSDPAIQAEQQELVKAELLVAAIARQVEAQGPTASLDVQLDQLVGQTIEDLNNLLRGTLPTLADLASQVAALSNVAPPASSKINQLRESANAFVALGVDEKKFQLNALTQTALALVDAAAGQRATADFTPCQMSTAALAAAGLYKPLMLGEGAQGTTIDLEPGNPHNVPIIGGLAPLSHVISGADEAQYRPSAEITMQGVTFIKVSVNEQEKDKDHTYKITVYDSAGASRWFQVKVPGSK